MKAKYLILFLILVLIFSSGLACSDTETKEESQKEEKTLVTETISKTVDVKYVVIGLNSIDIKYEDNSTRTFPIRPEVSVTYLNSQGGTEQISAISLKKDVHSLGLSEIANPDRWNGEIIAHYKSFPKSEFLYISAQNQSPGNIIVIILVNGIVWKSSLAKGMYSIATANGYYDK